jgi:uncharacterized membrane protein YphA (DoxX/SURF4 family)
VLEAKLTPSLPVPWLFQRAADLVTMVMFLKNLAIAGSFLLLAANGAGKFALDKA